MTKPQRIREKLCKRCASPFEGGNRALFCGKSCSRRDFYDRHMLNPKFRLSKLLSMAKGRAKTKGLAFDLDLEYLLQLWETSDGKCPIIGTPFEMDRAEVGKVHPYAPSLDRIAPSKGYTKGNVRIIAYQLNVALSEFGLDQFEDMVANFLQMKEDTHVR